MEINRLLISALVLIASYAHAEDQTTISTEEVLSRIEVKSDITPETTDLLGDRIDNNLGALSFYHTDITIPGNSSLEVAIHRTYKGGLFTNKESLELGDWSLDLPYVSSTVPKLYNGTFAGPWGEGNGCMGTPGDVVHDATTGTNLTASEYWHGDIINVPGKTSEKLLWSNGKFEEFKEANESNPSSLIEFGRVTKSGWLVKCLPVSEVGDAVQGFEAHATDGTVYRFDTLRRQRISGAKAISRYTFYLLASKVTDRFGNTVNYDYVGDADNRHLTTIRSSDGRQIDISYVDDSTVINTITANERTWTYSYSSLGALTTVTRPDDKAWTYNLYDHEFSRPPTTMSPGGNKDICKALDPDDSDMRFTAVVTHPNGTKGTFTSKYRLKGRANVRRNRNGHFSGHPYAGNDLVNKCFYTNALIDKTLTLPDNSTYQWTYSYGTDEGFYGSEYDGTAIERPDEPDNQPAILTDNGLSILEFNTTTITAPDNAKTVYYHNRDYMSAHDGQLIATAAYDTDGTLLQTRFNQFNNNPQAVGLSHMAHENIKPSMYPAQQQQSTIKTYNSAGNVSGTYINEYSNYNLFNQPLLTKSYQAGSNKARYVKTTYTHDTSRWLINLPSKTQISKDNVSFTTASETTYHAADLTDNIASQPHKVYVYNQHIKTFAEYTDEGNVGKIEYDPTVVNDDGNAEQYVQYQHYKRGQATTITLPQRYDATATKTVNLTVDDNGWVTQGKDFYDTTTSYSYDDMGRLATIIAPTGLADTHISWNDNQRVQTTTRCTLSDNVCTTNSKLVQTVTTYDGLYRPVLTATTDLVNSITVNQKRIFNAYNQPTFESYPYHILETGAGTQGTETTYDGLQRPIKTKVFGGGEQATEYLSGHKIKTTDFNNHSTTTTYLAYGEPAQDQAILIESPENVTTTLAVDVLGNINKITQAGDHKDQTISHSEYRAYDTNNRLCKTSRGDVGTTVYGYYDNNQLKWQANGVTSDSNTDCSYSDSSLIGNTISFAYDHNGVLKTKSYNDDSTSDIEYVYNKNGDLTNLNAGDIKQTYVYNSLRQLSNETTAITSNGKSWQFGYSYDTLGALKSTTYPGNDIGTVEYDPNAFGQPQQIVGPNNTVYAQNAKYYPTGSLNTFSYGNGTVHKTTLNSRRLPSKIHDYKDNIDRVELSYTYDNQSNITKITDHTDNRYSLTQLVYDKLDRLTSTAGGSGIGNSTISYDSLGNITAYATKDSSLSYSYDKTKNRLTSVSGTKTYNFVNGYDARGNVTNNGNRQFEYNLANQMTSSGSFSYVYDGHSNCSVTPIPGDQQ